MAMAPKENITGHTVWTSVYADALVSTVEPRSTDTRLIRTPTLYGQFRLSRQKVKIFSLKLTRFIRTPVNTDNGHSSESRVTIPCEQSLLRSS